LVRDFEILSFDDNFNVVWADPERNSESWVHDRLHAPWAMPPLTQAFFERIMDLAFDVPTVFVNNFAFMHDFGPPMTTPEVEARGPVPIWNEDFEPAVRAHCQALLERDYAAMSSPEIADALPGYFDESGRAFRLTTVVIFAFMRPTARLISWLEGVLEGGEAEAGPLAVRSLQGFENRTREAGRALQAVVDRAAGAPEVAAALKAGDFGAVGNIEGGADWLDALHEYTQRYGWRADSWYMANIPTWAEDDRLAMSMIARYLNDPASMPGAALARAEEARREATQELEGLLMPEQVATFRQLFAACEDHIAISEDRAFWQLLISGCIRAPIMELGRRLTASGAIDEANDIFHLTLAQVQESARDPSIDRRAVVSASKAQLDRVRRFSPPTYIGQPPSVSKAPPDLQAVMKHLRGYGVEVSTDERRINGVAASKGQVTGTARVLFGIDEAHRLQPGEIIVCRTTAPPWTSLFSIAGGVVSDGGGLLSHTAICAREYGIPAVVATQVATKFIQDGARITVDGEKGLVIVEG
jgi:pyruvate,water dikinase